MFVEERPQGEVTKAPAKVLKLSEAIRIGIPHVWEKATFQGCAIACAAYAVRGYTQNAIGGDYWEYTDVVRHFGVPYEIAGTVSRSHYQYVITDGKEGKSREQIADWLESQGL